MTHGVKDVEQLEALRGKVFEECRQVIEIKPFNRQFRPPASVELSGNFLRFCKKFIIRLYTNLDIPLHFFNTLRPR